MSEINNSFFYKNLKDAIYDLSDYPEEEEYRNFIFNGEYLNPIAQLVYEYNKILLHYTDLYGQSFPFSKRDDFKRVLERLYDEINSQTIDDIDAIKSIIVHLDLELGIEVYFTSTLRKLVDKQIEFVDYNEYASFDYDELAKHYSYGGRGKNPS